MNLPAPQERQPDVGIKEIQRVLRSVRWSVQPWDRRQSGESELVSAGSLAFQKYAPDACQNHFSNGAASGGGLLLQLSVKGFRTINRCANRFLLHKTNYPTYAINMEGAGPFRFTRLYIFEGEPVAAKPLPLPQGCLRIPPTFDRYTRCPMHCRT